MDWIDIGGGLSCNYHENCVSPSFDDYFAAISMKCPQLVNPDCPLLMITEFGKSLISKTAVIMTKIEDVISHNEGLEGAEGNTYTCITHVGADLMLRTAYCPEKFTHTRLLHVDADMNFVYPPNSPTDTGVLTIQREAAMVNIVGPLCFSGDNILTKHTMAKPTVDGDRILILDAGANTLSLYSRHCSRASPAVLGYRSFAYQSPTGEMKKRMAFAVIREKETDENVMNFWK